MYIKNGIFKSLNKISVVKDGIRYFNVSEEMALADGWQVYTPPVPEKTSNEELYRQRIVELIRERYSMDDEIAILRQRDSKIAEFNEYDAFAESCKVTARIEIYGEEEA